MDDYFPCNTTFRASLASSKVSYILITTNLFSYDPSLQFVEIVPFVERFFEEESLAAYGPDVCWVTFVDGLQGVKTEPGTKGIAYWT